MAEPLQRGAVPAGGDGSFLGTTFSSNRIGSMREEAALERRTLERVMARDIDRVVEDLANAE